mgnify:CR=1 FL=1
MIDINYTRKALQDTIADHAQNNLHSLILWSEK